MSKSIHTIRFIERSALGCITSTSRSLAQNASIAQRLSPAATTAVRRIANATADATKGTRTGTNGSASRPLHPPIQMINVRDSNRFFSSSAMEPEQPSQEEKSSKKATRKSRLAKQRKDPLTITPAAADRIKELLSSPNGEGAIGIRLGVKRRGCNGLSYTMNYAFEREPGEEEMEAHGVRVMVEPMALFNVVGTEMDWVETDMTSEFTFQNPNSKGECGCGESFNV